MYKLKITYDTGDSFHHETDVVQELEGISWHDEKKAVQAMHDIEEHYTAYLLLEQERNFSRKKAKFELDKYAKKRWFCHGDHDSWIFEIFIENDDGDMVCVSVFWTGYFETLRSVEVISDSHKITF